MVDFTSADLDNRESEGGVVHETLPNTDHSDASVLRQGVSHEQFPGSYGLVGWWPLSWETAPDLSGKGNHGTVNGATPGVAGRGGLQAMSFDGSDDYVSLGNDLFSFPEGTICAWVKADTLAGDNGSNQDEAVSLEGLFSIGIESTNEWWSNVYDGSSDDLTGNTASTDTWTHLAATIDGSTHRLYVNGVEQASTSSGSPVFDSFSRGNNIGITYNGTGSPWPGEICDVRVYNRALTQAEISAIYDWGSVDIAQPKTDGVSYYPLDGNATDSWGSNDGTTNGGVSWVDGVRGQAASFDGADDNVELPGFGSKFDGSNPFTWAMWVNSSGVSDGNRAAYLSLEANYTWYIREDGTDVWFGNYDDSNDHYASFTEAKDDEWYSYVGVFDPAVSEGIKLFVNGRLVDSSTYNSPRSVSGQNSIGAKIANNTWFANCVVDEVRLYDFALTPAEVHEFYQYGTMGIDMTNITVQA